MDADLRRQDGIALAITPAATEKAGRNGENRGFRPEPALRRSTRRGIGTATQRPPGAVERRGPLLHAGKTDEHARQQAQPQAYGDHAGDLADDLARRGEGFALFHGQEDFLVPRLRRSK
jgi:hypothetical protein